jgi:hypothetical protein
MLSGKEEAVDKFNQYQDKQDRGILKNKDGSAVLKDVISLCP